MGYTLSLLLLYRIPWSDSKICRPLQWWIKHSMSPFIVFLLEFLWARKTLIPEKCVDFYQNEQLLFSRLKGSNIVNLHPSGQLVSLGVIPYWGLIIGHSVARVSRSPLVSGRPHFWNANNLHSCHDGHVVQLSIIQKTGQLIAEAR